MAARNKEFLTSREAAAQLGVALSTIQLWTENGVLRAWKTSGGHRRIARQSVEAILRQQRDAVDDAHDGHRPTVVVVEDRPEQRRLYRYQFEARGLESRLVTAANGYEGLVQIGHWLPEVIITDLHMPGMDGFQMVRALEKMPELDKTLTIAVSALTECEIQARGGLPAAVRMLQKPVPFDLLERLVRERVCFAEEAPA